MAMQQESALVAAVLEKGRESEETERTRIDCRVQIRGVTEAEYRLGQLGRRTQGGHRVCVCVRVDRGPQHLTLITKLC
jgi:hypothetical protein